MSLKKEILDQALHFSAGALITLALTLFMPIYIAAPAVLGIATVRELIQHPQKEWYQLGKGSRLDLSFWLLGVCLIVGLVLGGVL